MTPQIALVLGIIVIALILFATERLSTDAIALGIVITLIVTGILPTKDAFAGFGSDAVLMILGLLIMTASLTRTGVVELAGRWIFRFTGEESRRILIVIMVAAGVLGAFISNAATTAFFLPITIGLAKRAHVSPSKYLMPLAFASILSSSVTLISTSTNIVVSGLITQYGLAPLGMYELAPVGIPVFIVGLIYMYYVGIRLIPDRAPVDAVRKELSQRIYITEIVVRENSPFVGKTLIETKLGEELNIRVMRIVRQDFTFIVPTADMRLETYDVLLVECDRAAILKVKDVAGIDIRPEVKFADAAADAGETAVMEVILLSGSPFIGRTLRGLRARDHYRLQVLAVNRHGEPIREKLSGIRFQLGDVLLVQGDRLNIAALEDQNVFRILDAVHDERPDIRRAPRALLIFVVVLVISAFDVVPLPVAALIGAVLAFVTRCITPEEAYRLVEWKAIILVGSMLALGKAMEVTGTAEYLAQHMTDLVGSASPLLILMAFFALTVALTPLSHSAAAIVMLPIAIRTAGQLGLDPRAFVIAIAVAATNGYLTPLDQVCVMVYGPGHYRFTDFLKVGALLTAIIFVVVIVLVPLFWPLT